MEVLLIFHLVSNKVFFALSGSFEDLIILITLSIFSTLTDKPINICALSSAFFKSNFVFFVTTSSLNVKKLSRNSFKLQIFGFLSTIANVLNPKEVSIDVYLNNCLLTVSGSTLRLKSIATLTPSLFDSSLMSLIPSIFFSLINSAILSLRFDLLIWYGIEEIINLSFPFFKFSTLISPLILKEPLPFLYPCLIISFPIIIPPVGKSGPGICFINSDNFISLLLIKANVPSITSPKLCGGILVAIPTAIPPAPLTSKLGNFEGNTSGSISVSS